MSKLAPPNEQEHERSERKAFTLQACRRLDPTPRSALIQVSVDVDADDRLGDPPVLLLWASSKPEVISPVWALERHGGWSAEFAVATAMIDAPGATLELCLHGRERIELQALDGAPDRGPAGAAALVEPRPQESTAGAHRWRGAVRWVVTAAVLMTIGWTLAHALQNDPPASTAPTPSRPAGGAVPGSSGLGGPLTPEQILSRTPAGSRLVATGTTRRIGLYKRSNATKAFTFVRNPNVMGAPAVFLVDEAAGSRFKVKLPIRPNGSTAWIRAVDVKVSTVAYRVTVDLPRRRLTVWRGRRVLQRTPIGVGKTLTPTPSGVYYITALLKQPNPTGAYGPYAFGLSAHSNVLRTFAGGNGRIGLHGTNAPSGIGGNVSHGCVRMPNSVIRRLARLLPLGTPVRITR